MNKNILIGSRALAEWDSSFKVKETTDWDVISDSPLEGVEHHPRNFLNNDKFDEYVVDTGLRWHKQKLWVMNPVGLYIIKRSHLWRDVGFEKHITHFHKHLTKLVPSLSEKDNELLQERITLSHKQFPQGHPKLNQKVEDFFDDYVTKVYNHDHLHELVAFDDAPLYTYLQRDKNYAWCERDLWDKFSHGQKCKCVAEEAYVIAIERFMVPRNWEFSQKLAYMKALNKISTTLCSGWFRDFAIDFYPSIVDLYDSDRFLKVKYSL